jgi:hypothetical protein
MERIKMKWTLEWLVIAVIIILCLPCHVGYTQTRKVQSWEDVFRQMQIKQAVDKAEKDMRRRGKLMMDLEREHPDLEKLGKAYEKAEEAFEAAQLKVTETDEYKKLQERLAQSEKEYEELLERREKDSKVSEKEVYVKSGQVSALSRQLRVMATSAEAVKPLYDAMQQAGLAYRSRLRELTKSWSEDERALVMREMESVIFLQPETTADFSYLFKDMSQAVPRGEFNKNYNRELKEVLKKENPQSDPLFADYVADWESMPESMTTPPLGKAKDGEEDVLRDFCRLLVQAKAQTIKAKEDVKQWSLQLKKVYDRTDSGSVTRLMVGIGLKSSDETGWRRYIRALTEYVSKNKTLPSLFQYISEYIPDSSDENGPWLLLKKSLEAEGGSYDLWLRHILTAYEALNKGWTARGAGTSDTVTNSGWETYGECMKIATKEAEAAIAIHPDWTVGYQVLFHANLGENELILKYFAQICKYRPDCPNLYDTVIWTLLPRWCGSHAEMEALAKACMETRRYDTCIPSIGFCLLGMVSWDDDICQWNRCYRLEWLQPLADELFKERISRKYPRDLRLDYAMFLIAAGRYDEAKKIIEVAGGVDAIVNKGGVPAWNPHSTLGNWYPKTAWWNRSPFTYHYTIFTGEHGEFLQELEHLAVNDGRPAEAAARLKNFLKIHELEKEIRAYLVDWYGRLLLPGGTQSGFFLFFDESRNHYVWKSAFQLTLTKDCPDIAAEMLKLGYNYSEGEAYPGATAIYLASIGSLPETIKLLKDAGDPLNRPEPQEGRQPIHIAAYQYNPTMLKCLIELGCDVNAVDNGHHTPLQMASANSTTESVELLLKAGATVELPDYDGDTALIIACQNGSRENVINLLLDHAKDVNLANRSGMTALHYAVQRNYSNACIEHFLKVGADILAGDRSGKMAYDYAKDAGRSDLEGLLKPPKDAEPRPPKMQGIPDRPLKAPKTVAKPDKNWLLLLCDSKVIVLAIVILVVLVGGGFALLRKRKKG